MAKRRKKIKRNPNRDNILALSLMHDANELRALPDLNDEEKILIEDAIINALDHAKEIFVKKRRYKNSKQQKTTFEKAVKKGYGSLRRRGDSKTVDYHEIGCYDGKSSGYKRRSKNNNAELDLYTAI